MEGIQRRPGLRGRGIRILEISTLDAVGRELTTVMKLTRQHLLTVADHIAVIELLRNPDESPDSERSKLITHHLRRAVVDFPSIDGLAVLNGKAPVIASVNPGENASSRGTTSYFRKALRARNPSTGRLSFLIRRKKRSSSPRLPLTRATSPGCCTINMEHLTRLIIDPVPLNGMGYVSVYTPGGTVIMHRDREKRFPANVSELLFIKEATAEKIGFWNTEIRRGRSCTVLIRPYPTSGSLWPPRALGKRRFLCACWEKSRRI